MGWICCINQNKAIFITSKRFTFKISKLIKSNQIKCIVVPLHNWMTLVEAGVTLSPNDVPEGKSILTGEIEIPCTYNVYRGID